MHITRMLFAALALAGAAVAADPPGEFILNVYDAFGNTVPGTELGWGYSALIRFQKYTILFDAGSDADRFGRNAAALGVDVKKLDFAVLSHSHGDHANGFDYVLHENPALRLYAPDEFAGGGIRLPQLTKDVLDSLSADQRYFPGQTKERTGGWGTRFWKANLVNVRESQQLAPGVFLIATRSELMGTFERAHREDAPAINGLPEISLALVTPRGVVIVTGCSHSGIANIVRETKKTIPREVDLAIGGFHLLPYTETEIRGLAREMKVNLGVRRVAPAHCTGMLGFHVFQQIYGENFAKAGLASRVPLVR
jgi:7,8-dihydropterin-6-yl-methyl-4-(beta-D-ribofuranosyl)aminobenzene 5'-phosphate synthase